MLHAPLTIQCCGTDFYKSVPQTLVTDTDVQTYPEAYGLLDADPQEVARAKKNAKFVLITGAGDFRQRFIEDIYDGGFKNEGFNAKLLDVPGIGHEPCPRTHFGKLWILLRRPFKRRRISILALIATFIRVH